MLIKSLVIVLLVYIFYQQIWAKDNINEIYNSFLNNLTLDKSPWLMITLFLMPLNWSLETLKWKNLVDQFERVSFLRSYKAILMGVTFSIFTPNRIGEYAGRILLVKAENNWKAVMATLAGSFSQLLVLLTLGIIGLAYYATYLLKIETYLVSVILCLGLVMISLMLLCFYKMKLIVPLFNRLPSSNRFNKIKKEISVLQYYTFQQLSITLGFALARYIVYTLQYLFILQFFGIELPLLAGLAGIATIFLMQTSIPLPPLLGLLVRGELALFIWSFFSANEVGILAATFSLWIINLIIPALIGTIFIININVLKSLGYEKIND